MGTNDMEAIARIRRATAEILDDGGDAEKITVRQIAERAGVGVGLINYHFGSKNALLGEVIGQRMGEMAERLSGVHTNLEPRARLSAMMKQLFSFGAEYKSLMQVLIRQGFDSGNSSAAMTVVPILREILGSDTDEMQLRIMALQILHPIQVTCLAPEQFYIYSGINIDDAAQRDKFVDSLISNLF